MRIDKSGKIHWFYTVGDLKKLLENISDETPIVIPGDDHSYREASAGEETIHIHQGKHLSEYFGEEYLEEGDLTVEAILIS